MKAKTTVPVYKRVLVWSARNSCPHSYSDVPTKSTSLRRADLGELTVVTWEYSVFTLSNVDRGIPHWENNFRVIADGASFRLPILRNNLAIRVVYASIPSPTARVEVHRQLRWSTCLQRLWN